MLDYQSRFPINPGQIQFWTAEMWSMLWNIWKFGIETKVVKELEFSWGKFVQQIQYLDMNKHLFYIWLVLPII